MMNKKQLFFGFQSSHTTTPTQEQLELFKVKYKDDYERRITFEEEALEQKYITNSWRNPLYNSIISIIIGYEHEGTLRVKHITGDEKDLLKNFVNILKNSFQDYQLVVFDAEIVLPYIGVRLQKNGFLNSPHQDLKFQGKKPWDLTCIDLKQYYKGAGRYTFSLEEIAYILDIDYSCIIHYDSEFNYYESGQFNDLKNSAIKKIEVISKSLRKLQGLSELETVLVEETVKNVVEDKPKDFLKDLLYLKTINKDALKEILKKNKVSKKDKDIIFDLIKGALAEVDVNFGVVKNIKEIDEIINQLKQEFENN